MTGSAAGGDALDAVTVGPSVLRPSQNATRVMTFRNLPAGARLRVHTILGEQIHSSVEDGTGTTAWDGRNAAGARVASGVYLATVEAGGASRRFVVAVER